MKKFLVLLFLFISFYLQCYANPMKENLKSFIDPFYEFQQKEKNAYDSSILLINNEMKDLWYLKNTKPSTLELQDDETLPQTYRDVLMHDIASVNDLYSTWTKNKNNMEANQELVEYINSEYIETLQKIKDIF